MVMENLQVKPGKRVCRTMIIYGREESTFHVDAPLKTSKVNREISSTPFPPSWTFM